MRKLKKQKLHAIYITIITTMICATLWTDVEFSRIFAFGSIPLLLICSIFDSRYKTFFE